MQLFLDRVADAHELALAARHSATDHDQALVGIHRGNLQIQCSHPLNAQVAGHLLVLEGLARILTVTCRTMRTVRHRHAVGGFQTAEVPPLHTAGKAFTLGDAADIDHLPDHEVRRRQRLPRLERRVRRHAELPQTHLRLDLQSSVVALIGIGHVLDLGFPPPELHGAVAVTLRRANLHHLHLVQVQHGDGHVGAVVLKQPGHAQLFGD